MSEAFASRDIARGIALGRARLGAARGAGIAVSSLVVAAATASYLRGAQPESAADVVLAGVVFGWGIPLLAYSEVSRVCRYGRLDDSVRELSRHGADRRRVVAGLVLSAVVAVGLIGALAAVTAVVFARGVSLPALADAASSAWIGAMGGAAYVTWLSLGSLVGLRGGGRLLALMLDAVFGPLGTAAAVPWPRAHLRSLIGGELLLGWPEWKSAAVLFVLFAAYWVACVVRVPR